MSEGYATDANLVAEESNVYDRVMDTAIALTIVAFLLGMMTLVKVVGLSTDGGALIDFFVKLFAVGIGGIAVVGLSSYLGVTPITSRRVRGVGLGILFALVGLLALSVIPGVKLATVLGAVMLVEAAAVGGAGVASRMGIVDTNPSASAGLLAGGAIGIIGFVIGASLGGTVLQGTVLSLGPVGVDGFLLGGLTVGGLLAGVAIVPREDIGSTIPIALIVGLLGATVVTSVIGIGWQWKPETIEGGFTGGVVIPLFVLLGSLLSGWAAGKCRAGFGARGRQYGSFLVINLNAYMMVAIMVSIVAFVISKGLTYAFHRFSISALSALFLLSPLLVVALNWARAPAGDEKWHTGARQFFRVAPLAAVGSLAAVLLAIPLTGNEFEIPFQYSVLQNRELIPVDTAFVVSSDPSVGNLIVAVPMVVLTVYFFRKYKSLSRVGEVYGWMETLKRALAMLLTVLLGLLLLFFFAGPTPFGLGLGGSAGFAVVDIAALATLGLTGGALATLVVGDEPMAEGIQKRAQIVKYGLFGGLAILTLATLLQAAAGVLPAAGPVDVIPAAATAAMAASAVIAVSAAYARRALGASAEENLRRRILADVVRLGLGAATGFLALAAIHVSVTGSEYTVTALTITYKGTFSWPMVMEGAALLGTEAGGILPAMIGTIWLVIGASVFAVPLGIGAAIFLTEYAEQGKFTALVEVATNALWSTPSVVFGLFGAAFLIPRLGGQESLLSAMFVLGFMLLPLVLITSREAIKSVPDQYRDASAALGVSQWETIRSVVLPAALPGVITGVILGVGRIAGETAPLILVLAPPQELSKAADILGSFRLSLEPPFVYNEQLMQSTAALPTEVWGVITAGVSGSPSKGWATAMVLLLVVLSFYAVGIAMRTYFRRKLNYE